MPMEMKPIHPFMRYAAMTRKRFLNIMSPGSTNYVVSSFLKYS